MSRSVLRSLSFCARELLWHRFNHNPSHILPLFSFDASSAISIAPRFFSSSNNLSDKVSFTQTHDKDNPSHSGEVISSEELKKRISKLEEGDDGAIPDIFEGILSRILAGKPEEGHNELRKDLFGEETESDREETESADDSEDLELDLDEEEMEGTDEQQTHRSL
ncbi:uncharacterized protein LOC129289832 [Prosopis cineraria]|uniref:uncharacterized protein LOC129289832 n=1 Tax=Prosopis cineraria TaxID=364024 RepID=UPI00240EF0A1|nr:uncharacterized protein LOC129289832 [Prosopis cineraria]